MKTKIFTAVLLSMSFCVNAQNNIDTSIITAFRQGGAGNCASVSVIKLAIAHYGTDKVFLKVDTLTDKYVVKLRDNSTIELSKDERATMCSYDKLVAFNNNQIWEAAKFMYAVMAKNKWRQDTTKYQSIIAVASYRKWFKTHYLLAENTDDNFLYLGLENAYRKINISDAANYSQVIITNSKHSAYMYRPTGLHFL